MLRRGVTPEPPEQTQTIWRGEATIDGYLISAALYTPAWDWAREKGIDTLLLLQGTGLDGDQISDTKCLLTTVQHYQLLNNIIALGHDRAMGLEIGRRARLSSIGLLGMMMLCAPTVRAALEVGAAYAPVAGSLGELANQDDADGFAIIYTAPPVAAPLRQYLTEDIFSATLAYLAELINEAPPGEGQHGWIRKIAFSYKRPARARDYEDRFQCPLEFGATVNCIWLEPKLVEKVPTLANALAFEQCLEMYERLLVDMKEDSIIVSRTREIVLRDPSKFLSLVEVAEAVALPPRTLQRYLARSGMSFGGVQSDVRRALAQDLLCNSILTVEEISARLGYSEPSNFRRAFRSWLNVTPTQYRLAVSSHH